MRDAVQPRFDPRAVVFDMDGLLLNTESLARRALLEAGRAHGLPLTDRFCELLIGVPADRCRQLLFEHHGPDAPADALFNTASRLLTAQIDAGFMALKPGVAELLDWLDAAGLPRAVATSSALPKALHHLERAGIAQRFNAILCRDDVARGKPHPDLYLAAAAALGLLPGQCLALEDSYNGVRAAFAAGMPVIMVPDLLPPTDEMRRQSLAVMPSLHQVTALLAGLPQGGVALSAVDDTWSGKTTLARPGPPFHRRDHA
ncbi:MAG: phosphatase [Rhodoferax sp.]|nr:phosphatase [Rhodoferax sp.]